MSLVRWVFVRHAQSVANAERWLSGHTDVDLTPQGLQQAEQLHPLLEEERFAHALSSDLLRARRTAEHALQGRPTPLAVTDALRERSLGSWTGMALDDLPGHELGEVLGNWSVRPPGGESLADVARRAVRYLATIEPEGPVLVVAHGGTLRALLGLADGWTVDRIPHRRVDNAVPIPRELSRTHWEVVADRLGIAP